MVVTDTTNDLAIHEGQTKSHEGSPGFKLGVCWPRRRILVFAGLSLLIGLAGLAVVRELTYVPPPVDGRYEWTLHFPGPSPGATFKTAPGDDVRGMLDILLVDAAADWGGVLEQTGTMRIELSHISATPLGVRLLWRFWGPKGSPPPDRMGRSLLAMEVRRTSKAPPRYELVRFGSGGRETVTGTFDGYSHAEDAILDDLARVMESVQTGRAAG
jgi:hypothetical protein